jgi:hypothetical protein
MQKKSSLLISGEELFHNGIQGVPGDKRSLLAAYKELSASLSVTKAGSG